MLRCWLRYLTVLAFVFLFYIFFDGGLSYFILTLALLFPVVCLLCSLPGMLRLRVTLSAKHPYVSKGDSVHFVVTLQGHMPFVLTKLRLQLGLTETWGGQAEQKTIFLVPTPKSSQVVQAAPSDTCGIWRCHISSLRIYDYLGLFFLPVLKKPQETVEILVLPKGFSPDIEVVPRPDPLGLSDRFSNTQSGPDPSETFALREYRPGDRLSRIHRQLSERTGSTIVKEGSLPISPAVALIPDFCGTVLQADAALELLWSLGLVLLQKEIPFWLALPTGASYTFAEISEPEEFLAYIFEILRNKRCSVENDPHFDEELPLGTASMAVFGGSVRRVLLESLAVQCPAAARTLLRIEEENPASLEELAFAAALGMETRLLPPENPAAGLLGLRL